MKLFNIIIILIFLQGCSFDSKTGIWKDNSNPEEIKDNVFKDFESVKSNNIISFKEIIQIEDNFKFFSISPVVNNSWYDVFYKKNNIYDNFVYNNLNQINLKSKKFSRNKIDSGILYTNNRIITADIKGNIIVYSEKEKKIVNKYNFYKKKFKTIKKKLNIQINENLLYVSDNLGFIYAYDYVNNKIKWAKKYKVPFRSNIKIEKNKIFLADQNNNLLVVDKKNGDILREFPTEEVLVKNNYENNLVSNGKNLFFLNTFGTVYSIDLNNLKINWFINVNTFLNQNLSNLFYAKTIKVLNNKLVILTNSNLNILDATNGSILFQKPISGKTQTLITEKYIFLVNNNNLLISIDFNTGKIIYSNEITSKISEFLNTKKNKINIKSIYIINNELYIYLHNSYIVKFNLYGEISDIQKLPIKIKSNPIFIKKSMLYLDNKNRLVILD